MFEIQPDITKEFILANVSQEEIFEHYLQIPVRTGVFFCSPLREDKHPTCNFNWFNGILFYRDWSESKPKDCFTIVEELYNCDFYQALLLIKTDLIDGKSTIRVPKKRKKKKVYKEPCKKKIQVSICKFKKENIDYLQQYGITSTQTKLFNVFSIDRVWIDERIAWSWSSKDPALAYYFGKSDTGEQRWKIYFYKRNEYRFLGNTNRINGWIQLPESGKELIITKSLKDVMCLHRLGYPAIAMQNENTIPYDYIIKELEERFTQLYSFYDYDKAGIFNADKLKNIYNIPSIFLTNGKNNTHDYQAKDISDYIANTSLKKAKEFIEKEIGEV